LYADNIVIITNTKQSLSVLQKRFQEYVSKWRCNFNNKKSQVVVHGRKPKEESSFYIDKKQLQTVTAYKYLGIEIQRNLNWKQWYKSRILGKAKKITIMIKAMFLKNNKLSVSIMCKIWNSLVRPILKGQRYEALKTGKKRRSYIGAMEDFYGLTAEIHLMDLYMVIWDESTWYLVGTWLNWDTGKDLPLNVTLDYQRRFFRRRRNSHSHTPVLQKWISCYLLTV